jgi:hypothetical protein
MKRRRQCNEDALEIQAPTGLIYQSYFHQSLGCESLLPADASRPFLSTAPPVLRHSQRIHQPLIVSENASHSERIATRHSQIGSRCCRRRG